MTIVVRSRRKKRETILTEFPQAEIIDVTSKGPEPWIRFSPFFPQYDIPVPLWDGKTGACVEAIWQALKVFESADVDEAMLGNDKMKNIKRTVRRFGRVLGHRRMESKGDNQLFSFQFFVGVEQNMNCLQARESRKRVGGLKSPMGPNYAAGSADF